MQVPPEEIEATVKQIKDDAKALLKEVAEIVVYGNGLTYTEVWHMSHEERSIVIDVLSAKAEKISGRKKQEFL